MSNKKYGIICYIWKATVNQSRKISRSVNRTSSGNFQADTVQPLKQKKNRRNGDFLFYGRSDWTRTSDLYVPNVAFYQAELHSVNLTCLCLSQKINLTSLFYAKNSQIFIFFIFYCCLLPSLNFNPLKKRLYIKKTIFFINKN